MGMNIKDPEVHPMARQLAARRGTTVTNAVRLALSAELERCQGHRCRQTGGAPLPSGSLSPPALA
ncbi:MAG: type II toxin-antitoxin system VapB family antitoxin [Cyanobium sp.]